MTPAHQIAKRFSDDMHRAEQAGCGASWRAACEVFCVAMAKEMRRVGLTLEIHFASTPESLAAVMDEAGERLRSIADTHNAIGLLGTGPAVTVRPGLDCENELRAAVSRSRMGNKA